MQSASDPHVAPCCPDLGHELRVLNAAPASWNASERSSERLELRARGLCAQRDSKYLGRWNAI